MKELGYVKGQNFSMVVVLFTFSKQMVIFWNRLGHRVLGYLEKSSMMVLVGSKYEKKLFNCLKALLCFLKICFSCESLVLWKQSTA